ncbi:hypothetical protein JCM17961_27220 [Endothiovibrio diazotrophicus]
MPTTGRSIRILREEVGRGENRNPPEGVEGEQVLVTGDEGARPARHRQFQELVVLGVAALGDGLGGANQPKTRETKRNEVRPVLGINQARQLGSFQHTNQLPHGFRGIENLPNPNDTRQGLAFGKI